MYWTAKSWNNVLIVNDAKKGYGDFSNSGISKIDENGMVTLYFDCPQNYSTIRKDSSTKEIFYKHVHFVINDNNVWQKDKIYTHIVNCSIDYKELLNYMKNRCCLLINSLPHKYYLKEQRIYMMSTITALTCCWLWKIHDRDSINTSFPFFLKVNKNINSKSLWN